MVEEIVGNVNDIEFRRGCGHATLHSRQKMKQNKLVSESTVIDKIIEYVKYSRTEESKCRVK